MLEVVIQGRGGQEVEDGQRYTANVPKTRPLAHDLALQRHYRHLAAAQVAALPAERDDGCARLQQRAAAPAPGAP